MVGDRSSVTSRKGPREIASMLEGETGNGYGIGEEFSKSQDAVCALCGRVRNRFRLRCSGKGLPMKKPGVRWLLLSFVLVGMVSGVLGCAPYQAREAMPFRITVPRDALLHLAVVPLELPDGKSTDELMSALLEDVARLAGGYTSIEKVTGGWIPPGGEQVVRESNCLLLVVGPFEVAPFLKDRLRNDFQQTYPFVISLPYAEIERAPAPESTEEPSDSDAPD